MLIVLATKISPCIHRRRSLGIRDYGKLFFILAHHNFRYLMNNFLSGFVHFPFVYLVKPYV